MSQTTLKKQLEPLLSYLAADCRFDQKSVLVVFREDFFTEIEKQKIDFWVSTKQYKGYFKECKIQENTITFNIPEEEIVLDKEKICNHNYILTSEQYHRIIKCTKCNNVQPI